MNGHRAALLIANDEYEDERLTRLASPARDVAELGRVLGDPKIGNFTVETMRNAAEHRVRKRLEEFFAHRRAPDFLLLHFSCHGLKNDPGELFLAAHDTRVHLLSSTAVSAAFVDQQMRESRAGRVLLLLDCCYGGAFSTGVPRSGGADALQAFTTPPDDGRGRAVITASNAMQFAFEGGRLADGSEPRPSVFTSALVAGLATGDADENQDGQISLSELYEYVRGWMAERSPHQTPTWNVGGQGTFIVAGSPRRPIVPAPLPRDLEEAMRSADYYRCLGAVTELQERIQESDLAVAAAAFDALQKMARGTFPDIRKRAKSAVADSRLAPEPGRLDFGRVKQGEDSPPHVIQLHGPPLARSCVVKVKPPWLRVQSRRDEAGFDAWVDTALSPRPLSGEMTLTGYVGTYDIPVEAVIEPAAISTGISFVVDATTEPGENIWVVGDDGALGGWDVGEALLLASDDYPLWHVEVGIPAGTAVEYKYVRKDASGAVDWEPRDTNRRAVVPDAGRYGVSDRWGE
ncbi:caspase, EACC1-associated type [Kitasatospora sp. LaBMicrA B282]|uniref:caspase, EACC1-associated type n=1 Tax=Kitasatospora sp. LaBMicrA B282 TaxID=3420949 RepID=UPI003D13A3AB